MAGLVTSWPNLKIILLMLGGCLIVFQGAFHWGRLGQMPIIILPRSEGRVDRQRLLLGSSALLWGWFSLCLGLMVTSSAGYGCELAGFWAIFVVERQWYRHGVLPVNFYLVKAGFTFMVSVGLVFAMLARQSPY